MRSDGADLASGQAPGARPLLGTFGALVSGMNGRPWPGSSPILVLQQLDSHLREVERELALALQVETPLDHHEADAAARARRRLPSNQRLSASLQEERQEVVARMPPALVARYERLRQRQPPPWVVLLAGGSCTACKQAVSPAPAGAPGLSLDPISCPACERLLIHR